MIEDLVKQIETRFAELGEQMTDAEVISDRERYAEVGRAYSQLEPAAKLAAQWREAQDTATGAEELLFISSIICLSFGVVIATTARPRLLTSSATRPNFSAAHCLVANAAAG